MAEASQKRFREVANAVGAADDIATAIRLFRREYHLDHVTYHLAQTIVDVVDSLFVRTTYPAGWIARYLLRGYIRIDPVVREGLHRSHPFDWSTLEPSDEGDTVLLDASMHGLGGCGYSIPIHDGRGRRSILSINSSLPERAWSLYRADHQTEWIELARIIHRRAIVELYGENDPVPKLGRREIECLQLTVLGNDYRKIAKTLGISEHTAREYLKTARFKLGCTTLSAATGRALQLRLINL